MKNMATLICLAFLIGITGCSSVRVTTDYDSEVDFTKYKTYSWLPQGRKAPPRKRFLKTLTEKRIRTAVERELSAKGYQKRTAGKPDFLIAYHTGTKNKVDVETYGYRYGRRGRWWGRDVVVHKYKEGTLIIDFIDREMKQLVWRGWAVDVIHQGESPEKMINESVQKIMEEFPPQ